MLSASDTSISEALSVFAESGLEVCLLVPTATGMEKSIMDATEAARSYLASRDTHNYSTQNQGSENKVHRSAYYVFPNHLQKTQASFYRPNTKNGDPRIWFYGLKRYADPYNLLAILVHENSLYIINCSTKSILNSALMPSTPLGRMVFSSKSGQSNAALELLDKLKKISSLGYIPTVTAGDTGIGMTLEKLLGIEPNVSTGPDYKGIEIKSKRLSKNRAPKNRVTLFSQVPDWKLSPIDSAWNLLSRFGYSGRGGKFRLSHQMDTVKPNSIGFILQLDQKNDWLKQSFQDETAIPQSLHLTTWEMDTLRERLRTKHQETFWVSATSKVGRQGESFHYIEVLHTKAPIVSNFEVLLETGVISLDYTMSAKDESKRTVRDHGYLFRIHPNDLPALFPQPVTFNLSTDH